MNNAFPGLQNLLGLPGMFEMQRYMSRLAPEEGRKKYFRVMDPLRTAAAFAGLLTVPELQSNCARIEMLVHQALALGRGVKKPSAAWIAAQFKDIGRGVAGRLEDPAEDVFVTYCSTSSGGYRVLEGVWESASFFLQRFVNVVEGMPPGERYDALKRSVLALLRLSDLVCERSSLSRYQLGADQKQRELPPAIVAGISSLRRRVRFSLGELAQAGIDVDALAPFAFAPDAREGLLDAELGHSALERRPIVFAQGEAFLLLPTAVSAAIRRLVLETVDAIDQRETFLAQLGKDYLKLFANTPVLGERLGARMHFHRTSRSALAGGTIQIDRGRYLDIVLVLDTLEEVENTGIIGRNTDIGQVTADLECWFANAQRQVRQDPDFVEALTILVTCGIGRATAHSVPKIQAPNWRFETLSAPEFCTLSWANGFEPLSLWRMLDGQDALGRANVHLRNVNGLLNLAASVRELGGHLVPHRDLPDDFSDPSQPRMLMLPQNALRSLRHEVASDQDVHVQRDVHGRWHTVRRQRDRIFKEDAKDPVYISDEPRERRGTAGLVLGAARAWWFDVVVPDDLAAGAAQDYWLTVQTWLVRAVPVLERRLPELTSGPVLVDVDFRSAAAAREQRGRGQDYAEIRESLSFELDGQAAIVRVTVGEAFESGGFHVENIAEQALIGILVDGFAALAGVTLEPGETEALVQEIAPDPMARQRHMFSRATFLDFVRSSLPARPLVIDEGDDALLRLELGWKAHDRADGPWIRGKAECLDFLNRLVARLEWELCDELRAFDRQDLIKTLLRHHEIASVVSKRWKRTAGAVLALRSNKEAVRDTITEQAAQRAELSQTARTLIELAVCEAPIGGGRRAGKLDLSRLLAKVALLMTLSGWSSAIRWNVMEPTLKIAPLGDILARLDFVDEILGPFARAFSDVSVNTAIERYGDNLREAEVQPTVERDSDAKFYAALRIETGASFDDYRLFVDAVENLGVGTGQAVLTLKRSALIGLGNEDRKLSVESSQQILDTLTLRPRDGWRGEVEGIDPRDLQLWRYRRRTSVLRKPIVQIDREDDPTMLVAPGLLRQGLLYTVGNFYDGSFPDWQLSKPMRSWQAVMADKRGRAFSIAVGERLRAAGWSVAEPDLKITKLLVKGFDVDHGDVDVLAWRADERRVLVIECKDVQFKKNVGEIAEQLADFQGEAVDGKRDYLRKHLDRMDLLGQHLPEIAKHIGWDAVDGLESYLVFKNPVPMQFALEHLKARVRVSTADGLLDVLAEGAIGGRT